MPKTENQKLIAALLDNAEEAGDILMGYTDGSIDDVAAMAQLLALANEQDEDDVTDLDPSEPRHGC